MENLEFSSDPEHHDRRVRIHIDRARHESPNPTTHLALYALGDVGSGKSLFQETAGDHEDKVIPRNESEIHLREDEHFYSTALEYKIFVNCREKTVTSQKQTYDEIVALSPHPVPVGATTLCTILYDCGPRQNQEGSLEPGESVFVKNGMNFNVTPTHQS